MNICDRLVILMGEGLKDILAVGCSPALTEMER